MYFEFLFLSILLNTNASDHDVIFVFINQLFYQLYILFITIIIIYFLYVFPNLETIRSELFLKLITEIASIFIINVVLETR